MRYRPSAVEWTKFRLEVEQNFGKREKIRKVRSPAFANRECHSRNDEITFMDLRMEQIACDWALLLLARSLAHSPAIRQFPVLSN